MSFHEVRFPVDISYGSRGGPKFEVNVIMTKRGNEIRVARQSLPRRQYDVKYGVKTRDQLMAVKRFFLARKGSVHGFRYRDPLDFTTASNHRSAPSRADHPLYDLGDGTFQLQKLYENNGYFHRRRIFKPVQGTVRLSDGGGPLLVEGTDYVVDYTTGVVTLLTPVTTPMGGCEFDTPVHFDAETDKWLPLVREDYDIGSLQSIRLQEIKLLLDMAPAVDAVGENTYPGPGVGTPGCVTCGGGGDPDPDYGDPDPNVPDAPPPSGGGEDDGPVPCECPDGLSDTYTIPRMCIDFESGAISGASVSETTPAELSGACIWTSEQEANCGNVGYFLAPLIQHVDDDGNCYWEYVYATPSGTLRYRKTTGSTPVGSYSYHSGSGSLPATVSVS